MTIDLTYKGVHILTESDVEAVIDRAFQAEAALREREGQGCDRCSHASLNGDVMVCDRVSSGGQSLLVCEAVGNRCGAWAAKEA